MEMTLRSLGLHQISPVIKNMGLPLGILMLVAMMVLPLPSFLLDIFFTSNILLSLLILMVAMNAFRPLDFSSFPTILLFATILRLGLNVASTRIVLSQGHTGTDAAGKVIEAFGAFVGCFHMMKKSRVRRSTTNGARLEKRVKTTPKHYYSNMKNAFCLFCLVFSVLSG